MTLFYDHLSRPVLIYLRHVIAIYRPGTNGTPSAVRTLLWTSPNLPDGYFGVTEAITSCYTRWCQANNHHIDTNTLTQLINDISKNETSS